MNSGLQVLISIKDLSNYFLTNEYFTNININSTSNKDGSLGEVACAYADLVKKLWISPSSTNYINSSLFKKAFGARY
jgi:ubiquitin C-terminal hydrolase